MESQKQNHVILERLEASEEILFRMKKSKREIKWWNVPGQSFILLYAQTEEFFFFFLKGSSFAIIS